MLQLVCKRIRQLESIERLKKSIFDSLFLNSTNYDFCFLILIQNGKMFYKKMNFEAGAFNVASLKKHSLKVKEVEAIFDLYRHVK